MNISKQRLQQIVLEEYMKEEGLQLEALSQERYEEFMDWIQKNGPRPAWLDGYGTSDKAPPPPPEVPGVPDASMDSAETMPFPIGDETVADAAPQDPEQAILGIVSAMQPDEVVDLFNNIIGQVAPEYFQEPEPNPIGFREELKTKVYDKLLEMAGIPYNRDDDMPQYNDEYDEEGAYDTGEERISPDELQEKEVKDLADKFDVEATVETASDGKPAILVWHQNGDVSAYHNAEEMYQDLASRQEMNEEDIAALKNV